MKIKTQDLIGAALDWAVAKCEGTEITFSEGLQAAPLGMPSGQWEMYSTNWAQGGPIIEREHFEFDFREDEQDYACFDGYRAAIGPTHLIAAMRCYCCSKLGDVIDIPEELCR